MRQGATLRPYLFAAARRTLFNLEQPRFLLSRNLLALLARASVSAAGQAHNCDRETAECEVAFPKRETEWDRE
jgi:hypothetical protein